MNFYCNVFMQQHLDEPMIIVGDPGGYKVLSNVCTHRGNLLIKSPGNHQKIICGYHGRRFDIDGKMEFMPEFDNVEDFPSDCDHLHHFPLTSWRRFLFMSIHPTFDLGAVFKSIEAWVYFLPLDNMKFDPTSSKTYDIKAHWALYVDNYLEGFHIPFVHQGLHNVLNYSSYETILGDYFNLQIGIAAGDDIIFDLPVNHPHFGRRIAAYYFWIFPNLMLNFYPWGLSVNRVEPVDKSNTKVHFESFVTNPSLRNQGDGGDLDRVELEDDAIVESVQKGMASQIYKSGRYSPKREKGVHHFHSLISQAYQSD